MNTEKDLFNTESSKSILNVDAQKELMDHALKNSFKLIIKMFLIIVPAMLVIVFGFIYVLTHLLR